MRTRLDDISNSIITIMNLPIMFDHFTHVVFISETRVQNKVFGAAPLWRGRAKAGRFKVKKGLKWLTRRSIWVTSNFYLFLLTRCEKKKTVLVLKTV